MMMSSVSLHHILMQCRTQARTEEQTDTGGCGRTLTDGVGNNGKVWRELGGWDAALQGHRVVVVVESLLIMEAYVVVLTNPGTTHGNAERVTHGDTRRNKPCAHIR